MQATPDRIGRERHGTVKEDRFKNEALLARVAAERERQKTRLKTLTWETLLVEKPFSRWDRHPPFPPVEFVEAAREQIRSTVRALQALGPKPGRPQVRGILRSCVDWFNAKDSEFGNIIETEEREDICAVLNELAFAVRIGGQIKGRTYRLGRSIVFTFVFRRSGDVRLWGAMCVMPSTY